MRSQSLIFDGGKLKALREIAGLTQAELGIKVGVGRSTIAQWESPRLPYEPSGVNFRRTCQALKCRPADLLADEKAAA